MRWKGHAVLLDVISFNTAISFCKKGGPWQHIAPLSDEMVRPGCIAGCDQFQRSHLSLQGGWTVAARGAIVR
eukprot:8471099-Karenia_brevis.AAC.1